MSEQVQPVQSCPGASIPPQAAAGIPFGSIPAGIPAMQLPPGVPPGAIQGVRVVQQPAFSPELQVALKNARDNAGGRYLVFVVTERKDEKGDSTLDGQITMGDKWNPDWWWRTYQLFVAEMLRPRPSAVSNHPLAQAARPDQ
jgi:hypothetical protein